MAHQIINFTKNNINRVVLSLVLTLSGVCFAANLKGAKDEKYIKLDFDHSKGSVEFTAIGKPKAIKIQGKGESPKGSLYMLGGKTKGFIVFNLNTLDTDLERRDEHMKKKYLETDKFPLAKLENPEFMLASNDPVRGLASGEVGKDFTYEKVPFSGQLTLHGVTRNVMGTADLKRKGSEMNVAAEFSVKMTDFNIEIPSFAGITVADHVDLKIESVVPVSTKP